jgi:diacylglycerol kinase family enzyme
MVPHAIDASVPRRILAVTALIFALVAAVLFLSIAIVDFPRGTVGLALLVVAHALAWNGVVRRRVVRVFALLAGAVLVVVVTALLIADRPALVLSAMVALGLALTAGTNAFRMHVRMPLARRPTRPAMIWNPRSGGGKAARLHLADEARERGIEVLELRAGHDLAQLAYEALDAGADAIAMAGGDGSQATVARIAAERGVPYACIPAGTRNHFALDLGVDRDDVIGALDAFVDGGERRVDLGEVNGRTFVNNVSLGVYGEAVQRAGYRNAKIRTVLETMPDVLGPTAQPDLRWRSPDGEEHEGAVAILVSNNGYRLGHGIGDGTRPRLDEGVLGVAVVDVPGKEPGARTWTTRSFVIDSRGPVHAGIDGEAVVLDPPVRFGIRPAALRCRIARHHPGASPSAMGPESPWDAIRMLTRMALASEHATGTLEPLQDRAR